VPRLPPRAGGLSEVSGAAGGLAPFRLSGYRFPGHRAKGGAGDGPPLRPGPTIARQDRRRRVRVRPPPPRPFESRPEVLRAATAAARHGLGRGPMPGGRECRVGMRRSPDERARPGRSQSPASRSGSARDRRPRAATSAVARPAGGPSCDGTRSPCAAFRTASRGRRSIRVTASLLRGASRRPPCPAPSRGIRDPAAGASLRATPAARWGVVDRPCGSGVGHSFKGRRRRSHFFFGRPRTGPTETVNGVSASLRVESMPPSDAPDSEGRAVVAFPSNGPEHR
jgi:hypothetical protein